MKNKELYKLLMDYAITVTLRNKYDKGKYYDAGKYGCHFEHIEGDFYGCYYQIEDSPFGDLWGMFIYRISEKGIFLYKNRTSSMRFYYSKLFEDELNKNTN